MSTNTDVTRLDHSNNIPTITYRSSWKYYKKGNTVTWTFAAHYTQHKDMDKTLTAYLHSDKEWAEWLACTVHIDNIIQQILTQEFLTPAEAAVMSLCMLSWGFWSYISFYGRGGIFFHSQTAAAWIKRSYSVTEWMKTCIHMIEEYRLQLKNVFPVGQEWLYIAYVKHLKSTVLKAIL